MLSIILQKQHQLHLHSHYTLFPQIEKRSYHKHYSDDCTICPVEMQGCLQFVLLNCYGVYNLSCWTYAVLTICPVELLGCLSSVLITATMLHIFPLNCLGTYPSFLLNCYNAYHLSWWTTGVCLDHMQLRWITCPKGSVPESEAQFIITFPIHDRGQQPDNILLLVCCKDVKEDVASCASKLIEF